LLWPKLRIAKISRLPGPLVVVLCGVAVSELLARFGGTAWAISARHLVQVPVADSTAGLVDLLRFPDFSHLSNPRVFLAGATIALVASLETLLNLEAVDKLDPYKRVSPPNRELIAQGVGNMAAGLVGGLPITSVIVRSSVNINAGARTKVSTLVHGGLLLLAVALLPTLLNKIPLASLAAILVATGLKLASPSLFKQMWRHGWRPFVPFVLTIAMILLTDLLVGVLAGLAISMLFILHENYKRPIQTILERHLSGDVWRIKLNSQMNFLNRASLSRALLSVPNGAHAVLDARDMDYVDADVLALLSEYQQQLAPGRDITVSTVGFGNGRGPIGDHIQYVDYSTRELREAITPEQILDILRTGNKRFVTGAPLTRDLHRQRKTVLEHQQHPLAVVLSGTSSRTPVEAIFDVGLGQISCVRCTGTFVGPAVLGSLEYAIEADGAKLIVVMGHGHNDAVRRAIQVRLGEDAAPAHARHVQEIMQEIGRSVSDRLLAEWPSMGPQERWRQVDEVSRAHVKRMMSRILTMSPAIATRVERGAVEIVGCLYDLESGAIEFFTPAADPSIRVPDPGPSPVPSRAAGDSA
jgi:carbonic anhydrase/SulP family sulfate permease